MLKTGIYLCNYGYDLTTAQNVKLAKQVGFDTFFTDWNPDAPIGVYEEYANEAAKNGMVYESMHAPYRGIDCLWSHSDKEREYLDRLRGCIDAAAHCGVRYVTVHALNAPTWNTESPDLWSDIGVDNFARIVAYGESKQVFVAFENVEFPHEQLRRLLEILRLRVPGGLRFVWDAGHEHCYCPNRKECVTDLFGDLLIGTHLHDNFGQRDPGMVTWHDDVHIMPFDGTLDYRVVATRLKQWKYSGTINLELERSQRQWRLLPWYQDYTAEEFFLDAYRRAHRIVLLCENVDNLNNIL